MRQQALQAGTQVRRHDGLTLCAFALLCSGPHSYVAEATVSRMAWQRTRGAKEAGACRRLDHQHAASSSRWVLVAPSRPPPLRATGAMSFADLDIRECLE